MPDYYCNLCQETKLFEEFSDVYKNGRGRCKLCKKQLQLKYTVANPERYAAYRDRQKLKEKNFLITKNNTWCCFLNYRPKLKCAHSVES